ncbi:hypothetical protein [Cesiribacter andamanensis]|uniref:Uncharacterized protein n=1 Tax=Cesiribacter andamanensis AMV16 TaxID=1279009 RepID=M7NKD3_9BACT|nr:hypothetical protein [Cesiribacter andamanensis]EMR02230.1 hypothetical protein ADICEAN_02625 [Cesiribacter andamanensis AMV16]
MQNITRYLGLVVICIAAIILIIAMAMGEPSNTVLATAAILGILGLLLQVFIGRSVD